MDSPIQKSKVAIFLEMVKFEHTIFALPFAYMGLWLAEEGVPRGSVFLGVTVAMVGFRTMAMGLNRLIDHSIDALNPRTAGRALPARKLSRFFVWIMTLLSFAVFEGACLALGPLCMKLSPVPVLLAILYPYMKRFSWGSHFVLGLVLAIAPYGAWIASKGAFSMVPTWVSLGVLCWAAGFDMIYALQDEVFDRDHQLHAFPAKFGRVKTVLWTRVLHGLTLVFWTLAGIEADLSWIFFMGLVLAGTLLIRENFLIEYHGLQRMEEAFFYMNASVSLTVFGSVILHYFIG